MWFLVLIFFIFAWRARVAFAIFIMAPLMGLSFGGFIWGIAGICAGSVLSLMSLGILIACATVVAAIISLME